ncbi:MAG: hypothetical protein JW784_03215 [Candidatus Cloacimonetes bacterium]|nr:hypothetical protein [Candidatus Cloacimonadota bacterium]
MKFCSWKFISALLMAMLMSSCILVETTVRVNKDGSGSLEQKILMRDPGMGGSSRKSAFDENELRKNADAFGAGVTFKSARAATENKMLGYVALYDFQDISTLRIDPSLGGAILNDLDMFRSGQTEKELITFSFKPGKPAELIIHNPRGAEDELMVDDMSEIKADIDKEEEQEMMEMMQNLYQGMRFTLRVETAGKIKETNATFHQGSTVTLLDIDFDVMMKDTDNMKKMISLQNMTPQDMSRHLKEIPGLQYETRDRISVKFN